MSKKAHRVGAFERHPTPPKALEPLLTYLPHRSRFCEPCAGAGHLTPQTAAGHEQTEPS